jgi:hypothetical protein
MMFHQTLGVLAAGAARRAGTATLVLLAARRGVISSLGVGIDAESRAHQHSRREKCQRYTFHGTPPTVGLKIDHDGRSAAHPLAHTTPPPTRQRKVGGILEVCFQARMARGFSLLQDGAERRKLIESNQSEGDGKCCTSPSSRSIGTNCWQPWPQPGRESL